MISELQIDSHGRKYKQATWSLPISTKFIIRSRYIDLFRRDIYFKDNYLLLSLSSLFNFFLLSNLVSGT